MIIGARSAPPPNNTGRASERCTCACPISIFTTLYVRMFLTLPYHISLDKPQHRVYA